MSAHALQRWRERHPGLCFHEELSLARRPSKRLRAMLERPSMAVPVWDRQPRRYLVTSNDVVFVIGMDEVVLTVLRLSEVKRRDRAVRRSAKASQ